MIKTESEKEAEGQNWRQKWKKVEETKAREGIDNQQLK